MKKNFPAERRKNVDYLTVKEVAELKSCSKRYIQRLIKNGKMVSEQTNNIYNNQPCYIIPVTALPEDLQAKYYAKLKKEIAMPELKETPESKPEKKVRTSRTFEKLSDQERQQLNFWCELLQEWQSRRAKYKSKTEFDKNFIGECRLKYDDIEISTRTLYRKWAAYTQNDYDGILGVRGGWNRGKSTIPEPVWNTFLWYWFDENRPSTSFCYRHTLDWTEEFYPEFLDNFPSEMAFRRRIEKDVSVSLKTLMRDGEKAFNDRCSPYIVRMYDELEANDCWIADNHTFDIQSVGNETIHRLYLTAFLDAKSGVLVGWNITENPDSQSTILALRHGISRFGIPKYIYVDNGREFLVRDFGGKGHRTRKKDFENPEIIPPTILQRLGIEMRNAIVRNAKAKPVERTFCTVKNQFSKMFTGFCGGTILERPECLKRRIKNGQLPRDYEVREVFDAWIDGDYNLQQYGGSESCFKGMTRLDVWNKTCRAVRKANESDLNLMLMRTSRKQKIKRNGVCITVCGEQLWFMKQPQTIENLEKEVYVRYDPADLRTVRIYEARTDKYLFTWELADNLLVDYLTEKKEEIADAESFIRTTNRFIREQAKGISYELTNEQRISILDMTVRKARANRDNNFIINMPRNIIPVMANEEPEQRMAVGAESVTIDLKKMRRNSALRKG